MSDEVDMRAVTVVFGNVEIDLGVANALKILELAGHPDIPVAREAGAPLVSEPRTAKNVHGENGLGNVRLPEPRAKPYEGSALRLSAETPSGAPEPVTLVLVGRETDGTALAFTTIVEAQAIQWLDENEDEDEKRNRTRGDAPMNCRRYSIPLIGLAALLAFGCTATKNTGVAVGEGAKEAAQQVNQAATDASITAAVKMKMADDPMVSASEINVDTSEGMVTLNGTVQNSTEADKAVALAKSVDGVKSVKSNLVVRGKR